MILVITKTMYPVRVNIAIMCFMGCFIAYMLRVNLSITLLAMIEPRTSIGNYTNENISMSKVPEVRTITTHTMCNTIISYLKLRCNFLFLTVWPSVSVDSVSGKSVTGSFFLGLSDYFGSKW